MSRGRKIVLGAGAGLLGLCLLALAAGLLVLRSGWFREQARARIVREVESATGGRAEIGEFRFDWDNMRAEVRSFVLHGTEPPAEPPLFRADSVAVGLKILSALRRDVDIRSLTLRGPKLHVTVDKDGHTNLPQPEAARRGRPMEQVLALAIKRFDIQGGLIEIKDQRFPLDLTGENLSSRLFYEAAGPRYTGEVSFRRLHVSSTAMLPAAMDADLSLSLEANRLAVREARFATGRSSARANGTMEDFLSPRLDMQVQARISLTELQALLKAPKLASGTADFSGKFKYAGLGDYSLDGRVTAREMSVDVDGTSVAGVRLASGFNLGPKGVELPGLAVSALGGEFAGNARFDKQSRFHVEGEMKGVSVSQLAPLRKLQTPPWDGLVSGPAALDGALSAGRPRDVKLRGKFAVEPAGTGRPLSGELDLAYNQSDGALVFGGSHLATDASRVTFSGSLQDRLRVNLETKDLADLLPVAAYISTSAPRELPVSLSNGSAKFDGTVTGGLEKPHVSGHVSLASFTYQGRAFDRLEADVAVTGSSLVADKLSLDQGEVRLQGQGRATLENWKLSEACQVSGSFSVRGLPLERVAVEVGSKTPVRGTVAGTFQVAGTLGEPQVGAKLTITQMEALGQRVERARVQGSYTARSLTGSFDLDSGAGLLRGTAQFTHPLANWKSGSLSFDVTGKNLHLDPLRASVSIPEDIDGMLNGQFRGSGSLEETKFLLAELQGQASLHELTWKGKPVGELQWTAQTQNRVLTVSGTGELLGTRIKAQASCVLRDRYAVRGEMSFARVSLADMRPWLALAGVSSPPIEASADGTVYVSGSLLDAASWTARVELPGVEVLPPATAKVLPGVRNRGLVVLSINRQAVRVMSANFAGPDTNLEVTGGVDLVNRLNAYNVRIRGSINLGILHNFDASLTASGDSSVDASIRGPRSAPEFYGRLEFKSASLYLSNVPNGVDNASGVILLYRDRATIERLTARTGGGEIAVKGFVGFGQKQFTYRLQATATQVRVRYPEGFSTSVDAALDLTGTSSRSLLAGTVTLLRAGVSPNIDLASLLARISRPLVTPATTNDLLRGMQFDIRVVSAPNARFDTMITRNVQAEVEMRVRGTPYKPLLLGRVTVNQGEVNFLGNRYTISRGEISFLNPVRLEPLLNLDLETRVRGVDVTLSLTGPADRPNLGYRSDPPLQFQEIVALLAVGRAPTSDPTLLARQTQQDQSWQQLGASTLVGQALAAPVAGRLQRFFGVSRIKIDPKLTGLGNNPEAQLTLEQQISKDITFTYVTSLAQEQQQLIRVEWNVSRQWSVLAVREENGLFGIEFQYRKQFR